MKWLKRVFLVFLLSFIHISILFYSRYYSKISIDESITKGAYATIIINSRNIEKYILMDALRHPSTFFEKKDSVQKDTALATVSRDKPKLLKYINVPKMVAFNALDSSKFTWISNPLEVKELSNLQAYLISQGFSKNEENGVSYLRKNKWICLFHQSDMHLIFTTNFDIKSIENCTNEKEYEGAGNIIYDQLNSNDGDVIYADIEGNVLTLRMGKNQINILGHMNFDFLGDPVDIAREQGLAQLFINANKSYLNNHRDSLLVNKFTEFTKLDVDTLMQSWNGQFMALAQDFYTKIDSSVTYDYDDDFNPIEVIKTEEQMVPELYINTGLSSNAYNYMISKKAIVNQNEINILAVFPLVSLDANLDSDSLIVFHNFLPEPVSPAFKSKFYLFLNNSACREQSKNSMLKSYMPSEEITALKLIVDEENEVEIIIDTKNENVIKSIFGSF
ncbi:MAG TPA: hypothetical protein P5235_09010 [Saprospiraceae bacterium]|nr:hypothetical protein [Saprospiraceae bacterium]